MNQTTYDYIKERICTNVTNHKDFTNKMDKDFLFSHLVYDYAKFIELVMDINEIDLLTTQDNRTKGVKK